MVFATAEFKKLNSESKQKASRRFIYKIAALMHRPKCNTGKFRTSNRQSIKRKINGCGT